MILFWPGASSIVVSYEDENDMDDKQEKANRLANEIRARREKEERERSAALSEAQLKKEQAPTIWSEIRTLIKEKLEALAVALGEEDLYTWESMKPNEVVIKLKRQPMSPLGASFDPGTLRLELRLISTGISYEPKIDRGRVCFAQRQGYANSPEEIADALLKEVAKWV